MLAYTNSPARRRGDVIPLGPRRRELQERGAKEVLPALRAWANQLDAKDPQADHDRLEALWVLQSLRQTGDLIDSGRWTQVLQSKDHRVRAAGIRAKTCG